MNILRQEITGLAVWRAEQIKSDRRWLKSLTPEFISAIDAALSHLDSQSLVFPDFKKRDFPIDSQSPFITTLADELEEGRGFFVLRGLPIGRYSESQIETLYYGIGLHLGTPVCQNSNGDLIGKVMNVADRSNKATRVYETNDYLPYHTDLSDVFGLLCIRQAKQGGLTSLVSGAAVYNELLKKYPQHLDWYYRSKPYAHLGDGVNRTPLFSYHKNKLSCRYLRKYIELEHETTGRTLTALESEALDCIDETMHCDDMRLDLMLEPGDMLFANNYSVMHSRTGFIDFDEPERRRKLLRLWLKMPNARQLAPDFPGQNGFPPPRCRV